jgi:hypothetical protein
MLLWQAEVIPFISEGRQVALQPAIHIFWSNAMSRTPNDDRSDSMNPNNPAYDDSLDNHANQLNPNNERYQGNDDDSDDD